MEKVPRFDNVPHTGNVGQNWFVKAYNWRHVIKCRILHQSFHQSSTITAHLIDHLGWIFSPSSFRLIMKSNLSCTTCSGIWTNGRQNITFPTWLPSYATIDLSLALLIAHYRGNDDGLRSITDFVPRTHCWSDVDGIDFRPNGAIQAGGYAIVRVSFNMHMRFFRRYSSFKYGN